MSGRTLRTLAFRDDDGWWPIQIPELTSPGPNGTTIVATGAATTFRAIDRAAHELKRDAVRALRAEGYPLEAAAAALGVGRQRIGQLEKGSSDRAA